MQPTPRKTNLTVPLIIFIAGAVLVIFAIVLALAAAQEPVVSATPAVNAEIPYPQVARVSLADAKAAYDSQSAVFVDTRSADAFVESHVPGAVSMPSDQVETLAAGLDKTAWIITYCT
jgi:3-mercaptopyruvate sulfurtransferase SseA